MKKSWDNLLFEIKAFDLVEKIYSNDFNNDIFPKKNLVFHCFDFFEIIETKVVFLGQDPYHNENQATGLSFSVSKNSKIPPSLKNIFQELKNDLGIQKENGDLTSWAKQGVLLLNSVLTVKKNHPNSHKKFGWEKITDKIIEAVHLKCPDAVFIFLGQKAQKKVQLLHSKCNIILSSHPSPFSCHKGFIGSKIFSKTNFLLKKYKIKEINW